MIKFIVMLSWAALVTRSSMAATPAPPPDSPNDKASTALADKYDDLVTKGYRWVTTAGPTPFPGNAVVNVPAGANIDSVTASGGSANVTYMLPAGTFITNGLLPAGNNVQYIGQNPDRNTDSTISG